MPKVDPGHEVANLVDWLVKTFPWLFDAISSVMTRPVDWLTSALTGVPTGVVLAVFTLAAYAARRWLFAAFTLLAFALIDSMHLWQETMQTLAVVLVAAVLATAVGVPLGILAASRRWVSTVLRPMMDFMQTLPVFVYLIPAVFFFGVGVVPGVVATTIFAVPPAVRLTELGIREVDQETVEAARAFGAHPRQILLEVELPLAMPSILAGLNQVIMMALSMVVVAGLTGAAGLGTVVVSAVTQLDVASGFNGGLAVVILAIFLDRFTSAFAAPRRRKSRAPRRQSAPVEAVAPVEEAAEAKAAVPA